MDVAYDHVQEEALSPASPKQSHAQPSADAESSTTTTETVEAPASPNLNAELQTAFKTFQSSQWGTTLGSWFSTARKQGEDFYEGLQKEAAEAKEEATKSFSTLREQVVNRTRGLSFASNEAAGAQDGGVPGEETVPRMTATQVAEEKERLAESEVLGRASVDSAAAEAEALQGEQPTRASMEGLQLSSADIVKEAGTLVASLRSTAASKLKDLQKAEDAADEALLKFGTNIRNFLRDAVTISAPDDAVKGAEREVLFETQEPGTGKKVVHATRLDAQLHAIHNNLASFTEEPAGPRWETYTADFDVESRTEDIAKDLERYEELRRAMEKLVPETVKYDVFWMRYYFLRRAVEEEEQRRREVLKDVGAATGEEEVSWDADSEDEDAPTPNPPIGANAAASGSTTTLNATAGQPVMSGALKPNSPRRSNEDEKRSVADSDASYDIVSGQVSRAPGSEAGDPRRGEESDDDWE